MPANVSSDYIYLDYAATAPLCEEAARAMAPYQVPGRVNLAVGGNANSLHSPGRAAFEAMEAARKTVARCLGARRPDEVVFTSGATEADDAVLFGVAKAERDRRRRAGAGDFTPHVVVSAIEHDAVLHPAKRLERQGFRVSYLAPDARGFVSPAALERVIDEDTVLVSVQMANSEVGSIQPVAELARVAHDAGSLFHTDAVQAVGHMHIDVQEMGIDMLSLSGHKFRGPRGTGVLYVKKGITLEPLVYGGGQERGLVSGTENTAGCIGLAAAMKEAVEGLDEKMGYVKKLTDKLVKGIMENIPYSHYTGDPVNRLPGTASFVFEAIEGEGLILRLDNAGVCGSTGSACSTGSLDPSHVLMAIGLPHEIAHGSLRLPLGADTTKEDIDYVVDETKAIVERLRSMSPLYEDFVKKSQQ